jgi:hypothetical protein
MQVNQVRDNMPEFMGFFVMAVALGGHVGSHRSDLVP